MMSHFLNFPMRGTKKNQRKKNRKAKQNDQRNLIHALLKINKYQFDIESMLLTFYLNIQGYLFIGKMQFPIELVLDKFFVVLKQINRY